MQRVGTTAPGLTAVTLQPTWDRRLARVISVVASPPVVGFTAVLLIAATLANGQTWTLAGLYVLLSIASPLIFIGWLVRQGRVSDLDLSVRQERILPLFFTLAAMALGWWALTRAAAPHLLLAFAAFNVAQAALFLLITLFWKISMHTTAVTALVVLFGFIHGDSALLLFIGVPLVAWSRLRLRRHTLGQTIGGVLLGGGICLLAMLSYGV